MLGEWLMRLEEENGKAAYLWPHTPVGNLQAEIWRRCGASDWNIAHPNCRSRTIALTLLEMKNNGLLPDPFTVLDLCCGDGVVLCQIGTIFNAARCFGVDLLRYPAHHFAETRGGVAFYHASLQQVVHSNPPRIVDCCIMLNTFRGWDRADLPAEEQDLPAETLDWMRRHCRYIFLTVGNGQMDWLKSEGWFVWDIGPGEDDSRMVCAFPCEGPEGPTGRWK